MKMGEFLEDSLVSIEDALWVYEELCPDKPYGFTDDAFRAIVKVFMAAMMDKMWDLQEGEKLDVEDREAMATKCGQSLRDLIKTYTSIDTYKFYGE